MLAIGLSSCNSKIDTPDDSSKLTDFHTYNFASQSHQLEDGLALFVDYSTCNQLGQHSEFFQALEPSFTRLATSYYSIKGAQIAEEDIKEQDVYTRLRNIKEENYAELKQAAQQIANGTQESVLLTDGEYFTQNMAKGHDNDPWLADALIQWVKNGHDIHIISEPYEEPYKGRIYAKKRFYILFTDDNKPNNIYDRICKTVSLENYPDVDEFHITCNRPNLKGNSQTNASEQNPILSSKSKGFGNYEIQDWEMCDWGTIEKLIVNGIDQETGESLENGEWLMKLGIDRNSFGGYKIEDISLKVYDINQEYADYYFAKQQGIPATKIQSELTEIENFMLLDTDEFKKHSNIDIYFNKMWFNPDVFTGSPYNYFKIDISIQSVRPIFEHHREKFEFEKLGNPGEINKSIASSIEQCLADQDILDMMQGQTVYSIYVKSNKK